jgi:hypothetical protein
VSAKISGDDDGLLARSPGRGAGFTVLRAAGVQSDMELAYAGPQLLCAPLLDRIEALPLPQRDALTVVLVQREDSAELAGLADADARILPEAAIPGRIDIRVRDRIVAETRGNPLALLESPLELTPAQLAGGHLRPDARPVHVTLAAAEPLGDAALLLRAAYRSAGPEARRAAHCA